MLGLRGKRMGNHRRNEAARSGALLVAVLAASCLLCSSQAMSTGLIGSRAAHEATSATGLPFGINAEVTAARVENGADTANLYFEITQAVTAKAFILTDPDRVIVDLPQVGFSIDPSIGRFETKHKKHNKNALIGSFRFGLMAQGRSRIVIDLAQPARIAKTAVRIVGGKPRLEIELDKTDRATFQASVRKTDDSTTAAIPTEVTHAAIGKPTVVIDAGHGGPDTGAMVNGIIEKDVTLAFARMLAGKLEASGHFHVVLTRSTDLFIPLSERAGIARRSLASLMISIHADTLPESADVSGATVYTVSDKASDAYAAKVAAKENEADSAGGIDGQVDTAEVNDILFDLTRRETRAYSHVFARTLVNYWKVAGRLNKNPQRAAGFVVLKAPDVPSVLLELGYLSSPADAASLTSDDWRDKATGRVAESIEAYFADQHGSAKAEVGATTPLQQASDTTIAAP